MLLWCVKSPVYGFPRGACFELVVSYRCLASESPFYDCSTLSSCCSVASSDDLAVSECYVEKLGVSSGLYTGKSQLSLVHVNARSLWSCIDEINYLLLVECVDILAVSETWLDDSVEDSEICPASYSIVRRDRNRRGGGVAIYLSDRVCFRSRSDICCSDIESIWIELFPHSHCRKMLFCCAYRSPTCFRFFDSLLSECEIGLSDKSTRVTIVGDLNSDLLQPHLSHCKLFKSFSTNNLSN